MPGIFPEPIKRLPRTSVNASGIDTYLSQGGNHQILFMECSREILLPRHKHGAQWCVVLEGKIDMNIGGRMQTYKKGDRYYIPEGIAHSGHVYAGYADITFFDQIDRCRQK